MSELKGLTYAQRPQRLFLSLLQGRGVQADLPVDLKALAGMPDPVISLNSRINAPYMKTEIFGISPGVP